MGARGPIGKNAKSAINFQPGTPDAPAWLDAEAKAEYERAAELLGDSMTKADMAVLAQYAQAWADIARMQKDIRGKETVTGPQGPIVNPLLKAMNARERTLMSCMAKLGFTPVDRARVSRSHDSAENDELDDFVK